MPSWVSFCSLQGNCIRAQDGPQQESWHGGDGSLADARPNLSCSLQWHPCDMEIFIQVMQLEWASGQTPFPKHRLLALKGNSLQTAWMLCPLNLKNLTNFCQLPSEGLAVQVTSLRNFGGQPHTTWCGGGLEKLIWSSPARLSLLALVHVVCVLAGVVCLWPCFSLGLGWLVSGGLTPTYMCHWICQLTHRILYPWKINSGVQGLLRSWMSNFVLAVPRSMWDLPWLVTESAPLRGKCGVLTSGPPGKSWMSDFWSSQYLRKGRNAK